MWDRVWKRANRREDRRAPRGRYRTEPECLERRRVLNASLAPLSNISVPDYLGYQVPLNGSGSSAAQQTFTVTSSNPDIKATVAQGQFLTLNVSHQSSGTGDPAFGPANITLQLFNDLTPMTATKIEGFVNGGFYDNKDIFRVANGFPDQNGYIVQGGSPNNLSTGVSNLPGTPFANEIVQQLAFTNPGQLAMANTGQPNSNDTQFFITNASQPANSSLDYNYTLFGQVVSGLDVVNQMTQVATTSDPVSGAKTYPVSPIVINTATLSSTNPNGVVHVDATQAQAGETSTITVTATDPATNTTQSQSFQVTVTPNPNTYPITLRPIALAATQSYTVNTPRTIQLAGDAANSGQPLTYAITTQPANGTLTQLNPSTGTVVYTPKANFQGNDSFQFTVTNKAANLTSNPATENLTTTPIQGPTAAPVTQTVQFGQPTTIQLAGSSQPGQAITYAIATQPTKGTLSQLNATTGTVVYTPTVGASGSDSFTYTVTNVGAPAPNLVSQPGTVTVNLVQNPVDTGAVRLIGTVLVVTPPPGFNTTTGKNAIKITETNTSADPTQNQIQVFVNGQLDKNQPLDANVTEIEVYGAKGGNIITVDPSVNPLIPVTLIGGHGLHHRNILQAGAGATVEQSWFGKSTLIGGTGTNELIARAGHVKFRPTDTTDEIFAGMPHNFERVGRRIPPGGTFFKLGKHGRLVPVPTPPRTPDYQDATPPKGAKGTTTTHGTGTGTTRTVRHSPAKKK